MFEGLSAQKIDTHLGPLHVMTGGQGAPLLLLHGYPQTHVMWHKIAPQLAESFTIVAADLPGYGASAKPPAGEKCINYSKRNMAKAMVELMEALGHDTFLLAGHDRGARVSYRLALDHPDRVQKLIIMDIIPTIEQFDRVNRGSGLAMYHWFFLAQPAPLPEKLIGADPDFYLQRSLTSWAGGGDAFTKEAMDAYLTAFRDPDVIRASCDDYRAGAGMDCDIDTASRDAGNKIACPALIMWGDRGGAWADGALHRDAWRGWLADGRFQSVPGGHFLPEEAPQETLAAMLEFLDV